MMGYAIYGAVYGTDNLFKFGIVDLGQVVFVFFVLVGVLERQTTQARPLAQTVRNFLSTPVIIGILLGASRQCILDPVHRGGTASASLT